MNYIISSHEHTDEAAGALVRQLHHQLKIARTPVAYTQLAEAARLAAARAADLPDPIEPAYLAIAALAERAAQELDTVECGVNTSAATTAELPTSPSLEL
jgi:hypothetical protein